MASTHPSYGGTTTTIAVSSVMAEDRQPYTPISPIPSDPSSTVTVTGLSDEPLTPRKSVRLDEDQDDASNIHGCCSGLRRFRQSPASVLVVVSFALFVDLLVYAIIIPVLPLFVRDQFNGSSSAIGALFACYAGGLLLSTPLFAVLSDRGGTRRWPMLLGLICLGASTVLFGISQHMWQLALARIAQGASAAATNTIGLAMVADVYPPNELGTQMGIVMAVNGLGALIGPPLGGALYEHVSFLSIFLVTGACAAVDLILRIILIDDAWLIRKRSEILAAQFDGVDSSTNQTSSQSTTSLSSVTSDRTPLAAPLHVPKSLSIWQMLRVPPLMITSFGVLVLAIIFTGIEPLLALHYSDSFNSSSSAIGYSYFSIAVPYMISSIVIGALVEKGWHPKLLVGTGFLFMALSLAFFDAPNSLYVELAPMIAFGLSLGASTAPPLTEIANYLTQTGNQASYAQGYALFTISYSGGMFLGPLISGGLYDVTTFFWTMMTLALIAFGIGLFLCYIGVKELKQRKVEDDSMAATLTAPLATSPA